MKRNVTKEQSKLIKKIKTLNNIYDGARFCGGILTGFAAIMLAIGSVTGVTSNMKMQEKADAVYASAEFQSVANEGVAVLDEKLARGEISKQEYINGIDAIYSIPAVVDYAENADDEELSQYVSNYGEAQEIADSALGVGLPIFGTAAAATFGCAAAAYNSMKKKESELEETEVYNIQRSFE